MTEVAAVSDEIDPTWWVEHPRLQMFSLCLVDDPSSAHGLRVAHVLCPEVAVSWLVPTLSLSEDLLAASAEILALPFRVRGGSARDGFTRQLADAVAKLMRRGVLVFVARGPHPNPIAQAGIAVRATGLLSASEACVAAAQYHAYRSWRDRRG